MFYLYVNGLMQAGAKKHLEHHDLWDVNSQDQATPVFKRFASKLKSTKDPIKAPQVSCWWILLVYKFDDVSSGLYARR